LKRFGSVTVLNGHIHQTMQKIEGNITFHTACSTAFPQPHPGEADSPGPMKVPAEKLRGLLGITDVEFCSRQTHIGNRGFNTSRIRRLHMRRRKIQQGRTAGILGTAILWSGGGSWARTREWRFTAALRHSNSGTTRRDYGDHR